MRNESSVNRFTYWQCVFILAPLFLVIGCAGDKSSRSPYELSADSDTWARYQPVSLNELKETLFDYPEQHVGITINAEATARPYRIEGVYLDELRPIAPARIELIRKWWGETFKVDDRFTRLFETELLFEVEGTQYWMPSQKQVIPYFQELRKGDKVELYVMVIGTIDNRDTHEWIIIVNEFQKKWRPVTADNSKIAL